MPIAPKPNHNERNVSIGGLSIVFFTRVGFLLAWLSFVLGIISFLAIAITVPAGTLYLETDVGGKTVRLSTGTPVQAILFGIVLGIVAEISESLRDLTRHPSET